MNTFVHPLALCESETVGERSRIWAFAHIMRGAVIGSDCNIGEGAFVEAGVVIGDRVTVKNHALLWAGVRIGNDVFVGPGVLFTNDRSPRSPRMAEVAERYRLTEHWLQSTSVERGASVGAGTIVLPGVVIGEFAMVGAGSVVTRTVAPHQLVVGNPARQVGWVCRCGGRLEPDLHCGCCGCYPLGTRLAADNSAA